MVKLSAKFSPQAPLMRPPILSGPRTKLSRCKTYIYIYIYNYSVLLFNISANVLVIY